MDNAVPTDSTLVIVVAGPANVRKRMTIGLAGYLSSSFRVDTSHTDAGSDCRGTDCTDGSGRGTATVPSLVVLSPACLEWQSPRDSISIEIRIGVGGSAASEIAHVPFFLKPDITMALEKEEDVDGWLHHVAVAIEVTRRVSFPKSSPVVLPAGAVPAIRRVEGCPDSSDVFSRMFDTNAHTIWLDSSNSEIDSGTRNRFSILADDSGPRSLLATYTNGLMTLSKGRSKLSLRSRFFDWLACVWTPQEDVPDYPCGFSLGWLGYLGYELKRETGGADIQGDDGLPEAALIFADRAIVLDHRDNCTYVLTLNHAGDAPAHSDWSGVAAAAISQLITSAGTPAPPRPDRIKQEQTIEFIARDRRSSYLEKIRAAQMEITEGNSYEVCLTNQLTAKVDFPFSAREAYCSLRHLSPAPFSSYLDFGNFQIASSSPERFLSITRSGIITAEPIKGTRPRLDDPQQDAAIKRELATSAKDRTENIMIVDLMRNDLSKSSDPASLKVRRLYDVESYATVHQMVSTIEAELLPGFSRAKAISGAFPAGSMTGVPKRKTMSILDSLEGAPRGIYSGVIGYFSLSGAADLSVTIRTLVIQRTHVNGNEGQLLTLGIGGAITADSIPEDEYEEIRVKATGILKALGTDYPASEEDALAHARSATHS
jgi:para-aminobenzoate synthetase